MENEITQVTIHIDEISENISVPLDYQWLKTELSKLREEIKCLASKK